jgi:hypothetical protein
MNSIFDTVVARAYELLTLRDHPPDEMERGGRSRSNYIHAAVCGARDKIYQQHLSGDMTLAQRAAARKRVRLTKAEFAEAARKLDWMLK